MSYHIKLKDYNCPNCNVLYIPYKTNLPCPNCGTLSKDVSEEFLDFVNNLIASLRVNKIKGGSYLPRAWYIGSFTDYIQDIVFNVVNAVEINKAKDLNTYIDRCLNSLITDDKYLYLKKYLSELILEILSKKAKLKISFWSKLLFKLVP